MNLGAGQPIVHLPRLYAIVDAATASRAGWRPPDLARAFFEGGARLVQLRAPAVDAATLLRWSAEVVAQARSVGATVIVNDRTDVALLAGADGVHLGQRDLPVAAARRLLGGRAVIGLSTHDPEQVQAARHVPVTYLAMGPVYATRTKDTGCAAVGMGAIRRAATAAGDRPVVAIGGITLATAPAVIAAGAASVAVISDLLAGGDPCRRVRDYVDTLGGC